MIVYLAARYSRRNEISALVPILEANGINVHSRWLREPVSPSATLWDTTASDNRKFASDDISDIDSADTLVFFSEDPLIGVPRAGRHVEFGYAMGKGKRLVVIGGPENVFHFLPQVIHYSNFDSFLEAERIDNAFVAD